MPSRLAQSRRRPRRPAPAYHPQRRPVHAGPGRGVGAERRLVGHRPNRPRHPRRALRGAAPPRPARRSRSSPAPRSLASTAARNCTCWPTSCAPTARSSPPWSASAATAPRFLDMVERLRACGVSLDEGDIAAGVTPGSLGRRHLAELLVRARRVGSVREAFARYLKDGGPAAVPKLRLPVAEAIALVRGRRRCGGVGAPLLGLHPGDAGRVAPPRPRRRRGRVSEHAACSGTGAARPGPRAGVGRHRRQRLSRPRRAVPRRRRLRHFGGGTGSVAEHGSLGTLTKYRPCPRRCW